MCSVVHSLDIKVFSSPPSLLFSFCLFMHLLGEHFLDARVLDFEGSRDGNFLLSDTSQCRRKKQVSSGFPYSAVRAAAVEWVPV